MSKDNSNKGDMVKEVNFTGTIVMDEHGRDIASLEKMVEPAFEVIKSAVAKS